MCISPFAAILKGKGSPAVLSAKVKSRSFSQQRGYARQIMPLFSGVMERSIGSPLTIATLRNLNNISETIQLRSIAARARDEPHLRQGLSIFPTL